MGQAKVITKLNPRPILEDELMRRVASIDMLRGTALMGMVMCHFMIYYGDPQATKNVFYFILNHILGDLGAACFLLLVGMSQVISADRKKGATEEGLMKKAFIRGTYIFGAGILMLALAWGPSQLWQWDILTLIGTATVALYFCRFLPSWVILLISTAIMFLTPWLRTGIDFTPYWGGKFIPVPFISDYLPGIFYDPAGEYKVIWNLRDIVRGFFVTAYFPVFPWLAYPLIGFVVGRRIVNGQMVRDLPFFFIIGLVMTVLGGTLSYASLFRPAASPIYDYIAPLSFFPDSITMVCIQTGMALILFASAYAYYDGREAPLPLTGQWFIWCQRMSRFSLTVYFLHYLFITWPLWIIYGITGKFFVENLMGLFPALLAGMAAVAVFLTVLKAWQRREAKYSLEWGLDRAANRFS
jgi:uncharacterized membrane protein